jgi:hypothetical protein
MQKKIVFWVITVILMLTVLLAVNKITPLRNFFYAVPKA